MTVLWTLIGSTAGVILGNWLLARWALRRGLMEADDGHEYKYVCPKCQCGIAANAQEPVLAFMAIHDRCADDA